MQLSHRLKVLLLNYESILFSETIFREVIYDSRSFIARMQWILICLHIFVHVLQHFDLAKRNLGSGQLLSDLCCRILFGDPRSNYFSAVRIVIVSCDRQDYATFVNILWPLWCRLLLFRFSQFGGRGLLLRIFK